MNSLQAAVEGKGFGRLIRRGGSITGHYGLTTDKMDRALALFADILDRYGCGATFPLTAITLARSRWDVDRYRARNIEFAVHGLCHVDHSRLTPAQLDDHLGRARELFAARGIEATGFRCPYLRWNGDTLDAVRRAGFRYDSSGSLVWPVVDGRETETYGRVLRFYGAQPAADYPALPAIEGGLVRMPYTLPDDEAFVDRLSLGGAEMAELWPAVLAETHRLGELFVLGLHPERVYPCAAALEATLDAARSLSPGVWIARLDEIAAWWSARAQATVTCAEVAPGRYALRVDGPPGTAILTRGTEPAVSAAPWDGAYRRIHAQEFEVSAASRPFIGLTPRSAPQLRAFLVEQGYIVETTGEGSAYEFIFDWPEFDAIDRRPVLAAIEESCFPLVRLGRWPAGNRSALAITGDIDALTLWDYGLRLFGR